MTRPPATDKILSEAAANADPFLTVEACLNPTGPAQQRTSKLEFYQSFSSGFSIRGYCEERSDVAVACALRVQSQSIVVRWTSVLCSTAWGVTFLFRPRKSPKNTTRERRCRKPIVPLNGSLLPSSVFKPPSLLTLSRHADAYRASVVIGFVMRLSCRLCKKKFIKLYENN